MAITAASIASGEAWKKWGYENPLGDFAWPADQRVTLVTKEHAEALAEKVPDDITDHAIVWGDPDRVAARCQPFIDAGVTHLSFWNYGSVADPQTSETFAALMSQVAERLRGRPLTLGEPAIGAARTSPLP